MILPLIFSAASLIIAGFALIFIRASLKGHSESAWLAKWRDETNRLIAEIDAATDRDAALVEERVKTLRALLDDVDRRIAVYAREHERRRSQDAAYTALGRKAEYRKISASPVPAEKDGITGPVPGEGPYPGGAGSRGPAAGTKAPDRADMTAGETPEPVSPENASEPSLPRFIRSAETVKPKIPFAEQVAELARAGFSPDLIAARLGATIAEVDLAIALLARRS
jgi:hypothetical protein